MPLIIQSDTVKRLYKTTNISILAFTAICLILFVLDLFNNATTESLSGYLILFSAFIFIIGITSALLVPIVEKTQEVSEDQIQQLLLNIEQKDFENGDINSIKSSDNFIVVRKFNHEINSFEAARLFETAKNKGIEVKLTRQGKFRLDKKPKDLFNDCIRTLWAASI
ncbi:MAG: hypothetical protein ACO1N7_07820 [Sphingobacteriaceae bacterium]